MNRLRKATFVLERSEAEAEADKQFDERCFAFATPNFCKGDFDIVGEQVGEVGAPGIDAAKAPSRL